MDQNNYIFEVEDLCKYFPAGKKKVVKAVDGINLKIRKGETIGLVGESGCGKTTCGRTIIKLYEPTKGKILFEGKDVSKLHGKELLSFKKDVQVIFQDPYASLDPRMTIGEIISEGMHVHLKLSQKEMDERVGQNIRKNQSVWISAMQTMMAVLFTDVFMELCISLRIMLSRQISRYVLQPVSLRKGMN